MKITYYVHDLSFPLVEGIRKQAWWMAQAMRNKGHEVEIVSTAKKNMTIARDGITIRYIKSYRFSPITTDIMHYLCHPSPIFFPLLLKVNAKKQILTFFDGNCNGFWKRPWAPVLNAVVRKKIQTITIQTKYQEQLLRATALKSISTKIIPPLVPTYTRSAKRSKKPSLLFMSHLSPYKGIGDVLAAYARIKENFPELSLVICDSSIRRNNQYTQKIKQLGSGVVFKGKVDSQEELSKAWVYLYPVHGAQETFSVPLSLVEAMQVGTPFICSDVGGVAEYFPRDFLVQPQNREELAVKIVRLLTSSRVPKIKIQIDNMDVIKTYQKLYTAKSTP